MIGSGEVHAAKAPPSRLHSNVAVPSVEEKLKVAEVAEHGRPWGGPPLERRIRLTEALGDRDADEERHERGRPARPG